MSEKTELSAREVEEAVRAAYTRPDEATTLRESVEAKCALLSVPGLEVEFDPEEAEQCGAVHGGRSERRRSGGRITGCDLLLTKKGVLFRESAFSFCID